MPLATRVARSGWWQAVAGAWRTSPGLTAALAAVTVVAALLPTVSALAAGAVVQLLPRVVAESADPSARALLLAALAALGLSYVGVQTVGPLQVQVIGESLGRRYMGWIHRRVMRAALLPATIRHLEDPRLHDLIRQSLGGGNPGGRATGAAGIPPGLARLAGERLRGAAALLLVAHFSPPLAALLGAVWLHHLHRLRALHDELIAVGLVRTPGMRYAQYLGALPTSGDVAKEVRVFGLGSWLGEKFERTWLAEMGVLWDRRRGARARVALAALPVLGAQALALGLIGRAAALGEIGLGALLVYATAVRQSEAFGSVSSSGLAVQYGMAGLAPLAELERRVSGDPRLVLPGVRAAHGLPAREIRFERVSFAYPGRTEPVFSDLTLEIPAGGSLAIVGANGAGKTTLVKLLARLHDPTEGRILVDGIDLREIDPRAWQRRVAAVFQDFIKYHLSAHDNIALGAPERRGDGAIVRDAARRAGALEVIERLPRGWDTVLSREYAGGAELSGGQWQRIALARALVAANNRAPAQPERRALGGGGMGNRAPAEGERGASGGAEEGAAEGGGASVLVLDEPTAHLDVRAEAAFYDSFLDLTRGTTTVLISHRFSTVRRADRIAVLEHGRVVERGSHGELIAAGGRYAHLFNLQAQRFAEGAVGAGAAGTAGAAGGPEGARA